jgi:hypothetical protein
MSAKERKRKENKIQKEEEYDSKDDDSRAGYLTQEYIVDDPWKGINGYTLNMKNWLH